ncbi:hypothetical protein PtrSN002B_003795 [Pyrenophora tritici-repentis]|nr:hypothetical protein PtrV1_03544 [Pyrenophora tritici-repentis]KAF7451218.1 hypothetical protein A1F99_029950 [Pyrenophora tritici-repentis]KAI1544181.1 hypothetical protein PtrSN001C_003623 [Pyrenophora tritici-repentis]KAI1554598.1 hypothetical protein PtrSN002B_003795 [Pyrenophora tritici-repentis]KAI1582247.1 hypothetical protein PtrEW7m1_003975 [Pyrenophora tritici-repentis]
MTEVTGSAKQIGQGLTQKTYEYGALGALVNIVTNTAGQVVSAVVDKKNGGGSGSSTTASVSGTGTPMPVTLPISSATSTS